MQSIISLATIATALLATLTMDLGSLIGIRLHVAPPPPRPNGPDAIGRWVGYMARGRFTHQDILKTPPLPAETVIGLITHYCLGIIITLGYFALLWVARLAPDFMNALGYGIVTTVFPWLIMFPALGQGWLGQRMLHLTRTAVWNHTWYGLGIALWILVLKPL